MSHPLFDLAGVSANCEFSEDLDIESLKCYHGAVREQDLTELRLLKIASLFRDALWGVVQTVVSDLDVDYHEYARVYFEKFRVALARQST